MSDIIVSIATSGVGAISIVRLSGNGCVDILKRITTIDKNSKPKQVNVCSFLSSEGICDQILCFYFENPKSYTGEDMCEIHCHCNDLIVDSIVRACIENGARLAKAGEFTMRAFLNGKLDLTRAEAVNDIICAESQAEITSAYSFLLGGLLKEINILQSELITTIAKAEVAIDFPEEDLESYKKTELKEFLVQYISKIEGLLSTYNKGRYIKNGIKVAIVGEPNVGKSMLLNQLLKRERAIVTDIAGTTRDTLEEIIIIDGQKYIIIDTAGIRKTEDKIEKIGIDKSYDAISNADIIMAVTSHASNNSTHLKLPNNIPVVYVVNKSDLIDNQTLKNLENTTEKIYISAKTGYNINELKNRLKTAFNVREKNYNGLVISNARHFNALTKAHLNLNNALNNLEDVTIDCILSDLNTAYRDLGGITGVVGSDSIIGEVFAKFCVGK